MEHRANDTDYAGHCARCDTVHRLPRSADAVRAADALMHQLQSLSLRPRGKMYGVLLARDAQGSCVTLRAFSGRHDPGNTLGGWVPPVPERDFSADETRTFRRIDAINQAIADHNARPVAVAVREIERAHTARMRELSAQVRRARDAERAGETVDHPDPTGGERERLRAVRRRALAPLRAEHTAIRDAVAALEAERAAVSRALHVRLRDALVLPNPAGLQRGVEHAHASVAPLRGGVGQCCAPRLLVEATRRELRPLAMAEFWWGAPSRDGERQPGAFYGACERCQPLLGHLLCGAEATRSAPRGP